MVKTCRGRAFRPRVIRSSPSLVGGSSPTAPSSHPLVLLPQPQGGTTLGLAPLRPLYYIPGPLGGPHRQREPGPRAQWSPPGQDIRSYSHHPIKALLEPTIWTCPLPLSLGGHTSTTTLFQGMLLAVRGICMQRFIMISCPLPKTRSSETRCS